VKLINGLLHVTCVSERKILEEDQIHEPDMLLAVVKLSKANGLIGYEGKRR
jgi:hypothetical protein